MPLVLDPRLVRVHRCLSSSALNPAAVLSPPLTSSQTGSASSAAPAMARSGHIDVANGGHRKVSHAAPPAIHHQPSHFGRNVDFRMRTPVTSSKQAKSTKEI